MSPPMDENKFLVMQLHAITNGSMSDKDKVTLLTLEIHTNRSIAQTQMLS